MIDIHCHNLPSIDDGAKDISESIAMAREAVKEGIDTIIATPHHKNGQYENKRRNIFEEVIKLNEKLKEEKIPLNILPGQETRIFGEMLEEEEFVHLLPLNETQYVFVEFPSSHVPRYADRLLFDIQVQGLTPVIVHPERNSEIITNPDVLYNLINKGALSQVTASSVAGYFGKKIQKFSMQLIEANLTHFLASDAHNVKNRTFKVMDALDMIEAKYGVDMVYFYTENAELLVDGKNVMKEIPEKVKVKKFLGLF